MDYVARFRDKDEVRIVYRQLKEAYMRRGDHTSIKMSNNELRIPEDAIPLLERIAEEISARYRLAQK